MSEKYTPPSLRKAGEASIHANAPNVPAAKDTSQQNRTSDDPKAPRTLQRDALLLDRVITDFSLIETAALLSSPTASIHVENNTYQVHEALMCAIVPYFAQAFATSSSTNTKTIELPLPNIPAASFELFLLWLYRGDNALDQSNASIEVFVGLYILADGWAMRRFMNRIMDALIGRGPIPEGVVIDKTAATTTTAAAAVAKQDGEQGNEEEFAAGAGSATDSTAQALTAPTPLAEICSAVREDWSAVSHLPQMRGYLVAWTVYVISVCRARDWEFEDELRAICFAHGDFAVEVAVRLGFSVDEIEWVYPRDGEGVRDLYV